jgi:methyl-accepting chemotaxis protein
MRSLRLSVKMYLGFGVVLFLLLLLGANSIRSVIALARAGDQSKLAGDHAEFILAREIDHLHWVKAVQSLFLQNQATLQVELDHQKCGLGKFLFGPEAKEMAGGSAELARLLEEIKEPHQRLHSSAIAIKEIWQANHPGLAQQLAARLDDHRRWAASLASALLKGEEVTVEIDPAKCSFGQWLASQEVKRLSEQWPDFAAVLAEVKEPHHKLHQSAAEIMRAATPQDKRQIYIDKTMPALHAVAEHFAKLEGLEGALDQSQAKARVIFGTQTLTALSDTAGKLKQVREALAKQEKAAEERRTSTASQTWIFALTVTVLGLVIGSLISVFITRSITRPLNRIIDTLKAGSDQVKIGRAHV